MELYIMRHGEAANRIPAGGKDSDRALTTAGQEEVVQVAEILSQLDLDLDFIATSPLKRSAQTAQIVARILKVKKQKVEEWGELKPEGSRQSLFRRLAQFKQESSVLVVGHEPYLSSLISEIVFGSSSGGIALKKAGLARIGLASLQPRPKGELKWLLAPKLLKKLVK